MEFLLENYPEKRWQNITAPLKEGKIDQNLGNL